ncbi:acyltransferase domain-containing protein [Mycobacterium lentiflavum]|uniref:Acyltransferase domain-containing protein n=2 Tax=Mycobacteriaceae TaxID=1762 RepID=A0A0E4CN39_MYCLN|nr:acyltransferase domain-containing protein [Mycobacterium lentiflavum]
MSEVGASDSDDPEIGKFDPGLTQRLMAVMRPVLKRYFRSEVHGLDSFPPGGALVVGNHSGGMFPMDVPIFSVDFYEKFGYDRPVYTLSHDILFLGVTGGLFRRTGYIRANRENAAKALRSGGVVVVFPGGDYDAYRPTASENVIDFNGRKGYVRTAIEAGVPIVPAVSIGGQETQLYLTRGTWLAERLGIKRLLRSAILPVSFGFPFGFSAVVPPNVPLPTKIVTQVLEPIDIAAQFGEDPDIDAVDEHVRSVMQEALKDLAAKRRFPILG